MYNLDSIKKKLAEKKTLYGSHVFCGAPSLTECMAQVGFDLLWIDMEHTAIGIESLQNNLIAARAGGTPAFVRIPWNDKVLAKPVIDMGPDGIIFPYIRTVEDAKNAVASCEYPPKGERGYGPLRALDYNAIKPADFVDRVYREMFRVVQIEHIDAVNNLEEIVQVEGIDAFIIGPNDLAGSVGHIGRPYHPDMKPIYDRIGEVMKKYNKVYGVSTALDEKTVHEWLNRGASIIFCGTDVGYVYEGAAATLKTLSEF